MRRYGENRNGSLKSICVLVILTIVVFIFIYYQFIQVDYHNLSGRSMAVSASTIKFVNQWLDEGAMKLHFTCYDAFPSIEFNSLEDRWPYLSYPTGSTALVWLLAKMTGRTHIGVSFLKHIQMPFFMIEALVVAVFAYLFMSRVGLKKETDKILIALLAAVSWMLLPGSAWYLSNVLYADQIIILYIMMYTLVEYIHEISENKKLNTVLVISKLVLIYAGILTDYYFWIFVFCIFLFKLIKCVLLKKSVRECVIGTLQYVCPVVLGVLTFLWQISYTSGWFELLTRKFKYRTNGEAPEGVTLFGSFCKVFGYDNPFRGGLLLGSSIFFFSVVLVIAIKRRWIREFVLEPGMTVVLTSIIAPVLQVLFLKNHSACHDFSMVKLGWIFVLLPVLYATFMNLGLTEDVNKCINRGNKGFSIFALRVALVNMLIGYIIGQPFAVCNFLEVNEGSEKFQLEEAINDFTDYDDMCFSFDMEIAWDESSALSKSEKCVYKVSNVDEMNDKLAVVGDGVDKVYFVIDKWTEEEPEDIKKYKEQILMEKPCAYQDDRYYLIDISDE